jgi:hypothetical protein
MSSSTPTPTPFFEKSVAQRFPKFELSYETISHKKVSSEKYQIALAIPQGKKYYAWFSFYENRNVCYLLELTREKKIGKITMQTIHSPMELSLGTVVYGTMVETDFPVFVIEDVYFYKGICVKQFVFSQKLGIIENMFAHTQKHRELSFALPCIWKYDEADGDLPKKIIDTCGYVIHHIQYRSMHDILPYVNLSAKQKTDTKPILLQNALRVTQKFDYTKPQYKYPSVFEIKADVQFDIYHLFAYGPNSSRVYCGVAGIPTYKSSVFMNAMFRNIRENKNLDYIEESDDEDDFENVDFSKYVNTEKTIIMECGFNAKFKKWIPMKLAQPKRPIVQISKL